MKSRHITLVSAAMLMLLAGGAEASELRYQPINPNFGGNPFNGSYLLGNADVQNDNEEPLKGVDPLDNFERTVTSSLLTQISQQISDQILGENAQDSGTFTIGGTVLNFRRDGDIVRINIFDSAAGRETTVEVPAPVF